MMSPSLTMGFLGTSAAPSSEDSSAASSPSSTATAAASSSSAARTAERIPRLAPTAGVKLAAIPATERQCGAKEEEVQGGEAREEDTENGSLSLERGAVVAGSDRIAWDGSTPEPMAAAQRGKRWVGFSPQAWLPRSG